MTTCDITTNAFREWFGSYPTVGLSLGHFVSSYFTPSIEIVVYVDDVLYMDLKTCKGEYKRGRLQRRHYDMSVSPNTLSATRVGAGGLSNGLRRLINVEV